eukprot:jgi/Psemu1/49067/gm1.49067_g
MTIYSVIPFKFDFDQKESIDKIEFKHISTTTNGSTETVKVEVPLITAGASLFQVLFTINEFTHAKKSLSLTTGPKQYDKFSDLLRDYANRNCWNEYVSANVPNQTVANFATTIDAFNLLHATKSSRLLKSAGSGGHNSGGSVDRKKALRPMRLMCLKKTNSNHNDDEELKSPTDDAPSRFSYSANSIVEYKCDQTSISKNERRDDINYDDRDDSCDERDSSFTDAPVHKFGTDKYRIRQKVRQRQDHCLVDDLTTIPSEANMRNFLLNGQFNERINDHIERHLYHLRDFKSILLDFQYGNIIIIFQLGIYINFVFGVDSPHNIFTTGTKAEIQSPFVASEQKSLVQEE